MIIDKDKTKEELIIELNALRQEVESLKASHNIDVFPDGDGSKITSEEKYRIFIELAADAFFHGDKYGDFINVNSSAVELTGYSREELLKMNMQDLFSKEDLNVKPLRYDLLKQGAVSKTEREIIQKSGQPIIIEMNSKMMPDGTFQSIFRNTNERRKAEEALKESEYRLARAEKTAKIGNWKIVLESKTIIGSAGAGYVYGLDVDKISLEQVQKIPLPEYRSILDKALNDLITKDIPYDLEFKISRLNDGEIIDVHSIASFDKINKIVYGVVQDITESKQTEEALVVAKERAEESDRLKSAFLSNMSHEIRTPMNGILGFAELLKQTDLAGEKQQEYIQIIEKSGNRMLSIINDIVDISKIESGMMRIWESNINLNEQIEYLYNFFRPEIEDKEIKLIRYKGLSDNDAYITTDGEKLFAILINLLKNAVKYTDEGTIEFGYSKKEGYIEFFIKDTGIGISAERLDAIFERFVQADLSNQMARQGAGLGLSISKAYVTMLQGKIWVTSIEGKGSAFYFTIPYKPVIDNLNPAKKDNDMIEGVNESKKLKILIAEDDDLSEKLIIKYLELITKEIIIAKTGVEALQACRKNSDIDLILMDIRMPLMDGYQATRQIRRFNKDVVIIAQTAYGFTGDLELALKAGCNAYISKPIIEKELLSVIKENIDI